MKRQVSIDKEQTRGGELREEASNLTVEVLRQLGVVLPQPSHLLGNHLEPVGYLGELTVGHPEVGLVMTKSCSRSATFASSAVLSWALI
jgi:hypothetical protein